jgi:hypothetical protein
LPSSAEGFSNEVIIPLELLRGGGDDDPDLRTHSMRPRTPTLHLIGIFPSLWKDKGGLTFVALRVDRFTLGSGEDSSADTPNARLARTNAKSVKKKEKKKKERALPRAPIEKVELATLMLVTHRCFLLG